MSSDFLEVDHLVSDEPLGADVVVIGGGVIGLSIAWRLARKGLTITVLESGRLGGGASGAAAGMLAPLSEVSKEGAFLQLGLSSAAAYPQFLAELNEDASISVE